MPDTAAAVIIFQRLAQRIGGQPLHVGFDRGTDGQTAAEEFVLPEFLG